MPEPRRSIDSDRHAVAAMWAEAFSTDPVIRWFLPDEETFRNKANALFQFIFDIRHAGGEIWVVPGRAAAAWTPPGGLLPMRPTPGELWAQLAESLAADEVARMDEYEDALRPLLPDFETWYLGVVGTNPRSQGKGFGRAVVQPLLDRGDRAGVPQSLETALPANRDLYERWGFEVTGSFDVAGSPTVWVMVRQPA